MARKSAYMVRTGMTILIDGHEQRVTAVRVERGDESDADRVVITCGKNVYRRTPKVKIDVTSYR